MNKSFYFVVLSLCNSFHRFRSRFYQFYLNLMLSTIKTPFLNTGNVIFYKSLVFVSPAPSQRAAISTLVHESHSTIIATNSPCIYSEIRHSIIHFQRNFFFEFSIFGFTNKSTCVIPQNSFVTPVYMTSKRNRNGNNDGLVFETFLRSTEHTNHWILLGVCLILNRD